MDKEDLKYIEAGILGCSESELTEDLSQEVDSEGNPLTPEQVEFFKNSKVRDSRGRLLVCYHGSDADKFNVFDHNFIGDDNKSGYGFYFTLGTKLKLKHTSEYACYINLTNPLTDMETIGKYVRDGEDLRSKGFTQKEIIDKLSKKYKCDGIINQERGVVAFNPNQIKSIDNKTPSNSNNINEDWLSDANKTETIRQELNQAYDDLIGNDRTRLYRYREWANNSNNDYKEYIYNDLLNGKKEDALHYWYNHYKLFTGNYDLSYDDFLNTPITLYRATNVNEKENATNPFFSYAQSNKLAQRFLDTTQRLYNNRTGEIEEIQIKPKDTLGMIPSDEDEIIVPNKAYQNRVNDMSSIVDNIIKYANDNNVKLPYDRDYMLTLFNKRDKENVKKLEAQLMNYIDKRKGSKIKESVDNKTFTFPNLRQAIDFFWKDRNAKVETVPIKKLVDDNNLLNDWDLQSYHQRQWDNKRASEFSIDKGKVNSMRISEVPYAVRKKDGKLELGDGRHRTRALYNDGYEYVTLPVITESISKTTPKIRESLLQEGKQDKENLDESLEDFDDEVGVVYHGGIEKSLHKDFRSILWFTEDYDYALDFGENIFICNLNLKNTFIVGNTDGYIRGLIPTQFSTDFTRLANNLKVTPKELLKCNPDAKNIYSVVRTKAFKELCIKNGYDSVETEEFGHVCFGVFNLDQVDIVDTDFEDESTLETLSPMDESVDNNKVAYRGHNEAYGNTLTGDIGFHFGTEKAAKEREQSYRRSKQGKSPKGIEWVINKYTIKCDNLLELKDNGGFNWLLVIEQLSKLNEFKNDKGFAKILKYVKVNFKDEYNVGLDISKLGNYDYYKYFVEKYPQSLDYSSKIHKLLRDFLKNKGYNGIQYVNNTEDKGSISYCIFDENDVQLADDETLTPNLRDIK